MGPPNILPVHGNEKTMNMNPMILTNIQSSPYFKVKLYELKTYHEVIDEIYFKVAHLEPWEKGSRKTAGQTGMCGGVRGVGAGGIVSSAYCLLYKLFTLRLTRKQLIGLITHTDSPYIRALGFMYIRYSQPPADFWEWFQPYLDDEEEIDPKAGGGHNMTIGELLRSWLEKLEWYSTLFPRIPVPVQKQIEANMREWEEEKRGIELENRQAKQAMASSGNQGNDVDNNFGEAERRSKYRESPTRDRKRRDDSREPDRKRKGGSRDPDRDRYQRDRDRQESRSSKSDYRRSPVRHRSKSRERRRSRSHEKRSRDKRSRSLERKRDKSRQNRSRSRDRDRHSHGSKSHSRHGDRESSFERDLRREKERQKTKHRSYRD